MDFAAFGVDKFKSADATEGMLRFDYGYAITCHKAQGAEWGRVLVVAERHDWMDTARWLYTAVTRAKEHVSVVLR